VPENLLTNRPSRPLYRQKALVSALHQRGNQVKNQNRIKIWAVSAAVAPVLLFATLAAAQTQHTTSKRPAQPSAPVATVLERKEAIEKAWATDDQIQLVKQLRKNPTLLADVASNPSLLANHDYVNNHDSQLSSFLDAHPEIVRNPSFYLFTPMDAEQVGADLALQRTVWPDLTQSQHEHNGYQIVYTASAFNQFVDSVSPVLAFGCFLVALVWLIRAFLENRRWNRIFKLQSEVHGKLIDKFGTTQELAQYMETEAGRRFLEAAPISVGFEPEKRIPNAIARVLKPLQIGAVLVLAGLGLFGIHHACTGRSFFVPWELPIMVLNYLAMMTGLGFILSAGIAWFLAIRLGLIPEKPVVENKPDTLPNSTLDPRERQ
jgi:hypothetical protein